LRLGAAALLSIGLSLTSATAQQATTLKSIDGKVTLTGKLRGMEGNFYVLETPSGVYRAHSRTYTCEGDCPDLGVATSVAPETTAAEATVTQTEAPAVGDDVAFAIHGSRTVGTNLMPNLLKGYAAAIGATVEITNPAKSEFVATMTKDGAVLAVIDLQTKGSGSAFPSLGDGTAEIGMADRRMTDKDLTALAAGGIGDLRGTKDELVIGLDGIVAIVNPANPLSSISFQDLSRIYSGEVTNWKEINGVDLPITVHSWPDGSGDRDIFLSRAVLPYGKTETEAAIEHIEYLEMPAAVLADPGAIGFVGRSFVGKDAKILSIRESCGLISSPTNFRMKTEGYAMSRRIYLYKKPGVIHPIAQAIIDFAFTPAGQKIIVETGFVDSILETQTLADMDVELDHAKGEPDFDQPTFDVLLADMAKGERLSVAFRFPFGKSALDPLSEEKLKAFAADVMAGKFAGREILVAGFTDSVGGFADNKRLAQKRADAVATELRTLIGSAADSVTVTPVSYGELLPYLCEEDDFGRDANRRVELWLR